MKMSFYLASSSCMELIDTLWNVNVLSISSNFFKKDELIDTLWNVNDVITEVPATFAAN